MLNTTSLQRSKIVIAFLIGLFVYLIAAFANVSAQALSKENERIVQYEMTFPIKELGNCGSITSCKGYCDLPVNRAACSNFARTKKLTIGKTKVNEKQVKALSFAKEELGCNTVDSCRAICEEKTNWEICQSFAQKHKLTQQTIPSETADNELLNAARNDLGCDSQESCFALCEEDKNYTKCAGLAQKYVSREDREMFNKYRSQIQEFLGCDSMATCMAFCMNPINTPKCMEFGKKMGFADNEAPPSESPEVWCPKISSECTWDGANCVCNGPQTCSQSNQIPGCTWDGTQCNCPGTNIDEPPEVWCPKAGPGCSWDGKQCTCPGSGSPTQTDFTQPTQEPGEVWCPRIGPYCVWDGSSCTCWDDCIKAGGTWTGSKCDYQEGKTTTQQDQKVDFSAQCLSQTGCTWDEALRICSCQTQTTPSCPPGQIMDTNGSCRPEGVSTEGGETVTESQCLAASCNWTANTCQCPDTKGVQGTSTKRSLLQQILNFFLRL